MWIQLINPLARIMMIACATAFTSYWFFAEAKPVLNKFPRIEDCGNPELQKALERAVRNRIGDSFWHNVQNGRASLALVDITDLQNPKMAELNGNNMMYAASLPKLAILLGMFVLIDQGQIHFSDDIRRSLTLMIRHSSNEAATEMLHQVGYERLADILRSDKYQLYAQRYNGGLWIGRDYAGSPVWQRDPLHNISHGATAIQTARLYYLLLTEQLVSPALTRDMLQILSDSSINHKFVKGLRDEPDVKIYRKSGTWRQYHADSGIIVHKDFKYIVVALIKNQRGGSMMVRLIDTIDDVVTQLHP